MERTEENLALPWWFHGPGSGVASVLKERSAASLRLGGPSSFHSYFGYQLLKISYTSLYSAAYLFNGILYV